MAISHMICDALVEANEHLNIDTFLKSDSERNIDVQAYSKLDDSILDRIRFSHNKDGKMDKAKKIVERIQERKLYKFIGETASYEDKKGFKTVSDAIEKCLEAVYESAEAQVKEQLLMTPPEMKKHLCVNEVQFNYGSGDKNPVENMRFYQKSNENEAFQRPREKASCMIPSRFQEYRVRVYFTKEDPEESLCTFILSCLEKWCEDVGLKVMMTPFKLSTRGDPGKKDKDGVKTNLYKVFSN
jgi:HD superfamily phosphohydrolase